MRYVVVELVVDLGDDEKDDKWSFNFIWMKIEDSSLLGDRNDAKWIRHSKLDEDTNVIWAFVPDHISKMEAEGILKNDICKYLFNKVEKYSSVLASLRE